MTPAIRQALPGDCIRLHEMIVQHAAFEANTASVTPAELEQLLGARPCPFTLLVAEWQARLVGYAALTFDWSLWRGQRYGHLDCLFVDAGVRGRGVGELLMSAVGDVALSQGVSRLEWNTPHWNENAARFYLRRGASALIKTRFALDLRLSSVTPDTVGESF